MWRRWDTSHGAPSGRRIFLPGVPEKKKKKNSMGSILRRMNRRDLYTSNGDRRHLLSKSWKFVSSFISHSSRKNLLKKKKCTHIRTRYVHVKQNRYIFKICNWFCDCVITTSLFCDLKKKKFFLFILQKNHCTNVLCVTMRLSVQIKSRTRNSHCSKKKKRKIRRDLPGSIARFHRRSEVGQTVPGRIEFKKK